MPIKARGGLLLVEQCGNTQTGSLQKEVGWCEVLGDGEVIILGQAQEHLLQDTTKGIFTNQRRSLNNQQTRSQRQQQPRTAKYSQVKVMVRQSKVNFEICNLQISKLTLLHFLP